MPKVPCNIVYPIEGQDYPVTFPPDPGEVDAALITASFSVTCPGGPQIVNWYFDDNPAGNATFNDQITIQFVYQLSTGPHTFSVTSPCGTDSVNFTVG
jgi:hypothetical protein